MALTINAKTFNKRRATSDSVEFLESTSGLNTPFVLNQGRTNPSPSVKNSVLRGDVRLSLTYLDANGNPRIAVVRMSSSIPADCPPATITALKADTKAAVALDSAVVDVLFSGKLAEY